MNKLKKNLLRYGILNDKNYVRAYWWHSDAYTNFGDIVTPYLINKITGKKALHCSPYCIKEFYLMTGSIIRRSCNHSIIWGSGLLQKKEIIKRPKEVHAVRGPITRKRMIELGYDCPKVYGDPALLLPRFYSPVIEKKWRLGIIPHYCDYDDVRRRVQDDRIHVINLLAPVEKVVDQILQCEWTISSSLHGIIASHTYNIPSVWVKFSNKLTGDDSKFEDYYLSVGMNFPNPHYLSKSNYLYNNLSELNINSRSDININLDKLLECCPI